MNRKVFYTLGVIVLTLSFVLSACAGGGAPATSAPAATQAPAATEAPVVTQAPAATEAPAATQAATEAPAETQAATEGAGALLWTTDVKQAIAAAIDREALVDRVFEGRNIPAYHMVPKDYPFATEPFLDKYGTRNLDMAKELLTKAGYTADNPLTFDLWYPPEHYGTTTADVMTVLKEQLEETGLIKVTLKEQNWAEYSKAYRAGKFPMWIAGWFPDFVDPDTWLSPFATCTQSPNLGISYCNKQMDDLLTQAAASSDQTKRADLYKQVGELYANEVPTIPLYFEPEFITSRKGVEGIAIGAPFEFNYNVLSFADGYKSASGKDDTIIIGTTDVVQSLDANDAYATHDWEILKNTGVPLLKYTPGTADLVPGAADMPTISEDGKTYTFKLRDGIKFADGTPLTAKDYVYAFDRYKLNGDVAGLITAYVAKCEAPDDQTVVYTLTDSWGFFPALAATAPFVPVDQNTFKPDALNKFPDTLNGIGPYRMVSNKPEEQMVLEANPNYFDTDKPKIKNVIIRYFADPTTMSQAVEKGEIDIAWRILGAVEATRLQGVADTAGLVVTKVNAPALRYLGFNNTQQKGAVNP